MSLYFLVDTKGKQLNKTLRYRPSHHNAGSTRSVGVEASLDAKVSDRWNISGSYGFTKAQFTDYITVKGDDYKGKHSLCASSYRSSKHPICPPPQV